MRHMTYRLLVDLDKAGLSFQGDVSELMLDFLPVAALEAEPPVARDALLVPLTRLVLHITT